MIKTPLATTTTSTLQMSTRVRRLLAGSLALAMPLTVIGPATAAAAESSDEASTSMTDTVSLLDPAIYNTLTERQRQAVDELVERFGDDVVRDVAVPDTEFGVEATAFGGMAGWFAQELLSWGFGVGLDFGFGALTGQLGLGGGDNSAMEQLNESLNKLNMTVEQIHDELRQLADHQMWTAFHDAHGEAKGEINEIRGRARDIANFELLGIEPNADNVRYIATSTDDALLDLGPTILNDLGGGAIPALIALENHIAPVSDGVENWDRLLTLVDQYRASYALGIMNLVWAAQYDEAHDAAWRVQLKSRSEEAIERSELIFDHIGAPYPQRPDEDPFVHITGADWALVNPDRAPYLDEDINGRIMTGGAGVLMRAVADSYRSTDGSTLRQYLEARNVSPIVHFANGFSWNYSSCFGHNRSWWRDYDLYRTVGEIQGNSYQQYVSKYSTLREKCHVPTIEAEVINPRIDQEIQKIHDDPWLADITTGLQVNPRTGMPALWGEGNEEAIRAARDGVANLAIERGNGNRVDVSLDNTGYDALRVVRAGTEEVLARHHLASLPTSLGTLNAPDGAVEIQLGYAIDGNLGVFDARATSTIIVNPDHDTINLDVTIR